jgi:hypothetical protein
MRPNWTVLTVALLALSSTVAHAQRSGLGIKGGPLVSDLRAANYRTSMLPGATLGMYAPIGIGTRLELQPELLAAAMGALQRRPERMPTTTRLMYVQVPVSAKIYLGNDFNVLAGVQTGCMVAARRVAEEGTTDISDDIERIDFGINLGIGLDTRRGVDLGLRYYSGLTDVLDENTSFFPRNRSVQLTAGYRFMAFDKISTVRRRH